MTGSSFDFIIVGAGAAGCVVASRLSANPDVSVLLIEAGEGASNPNIADPQGFVSLWGSELDWKISTEAQTGATGREILINQGKVIGGSTSINALMWVRGNRRNFDEWAAQGATGWGYDDLLPIFKKVEDFTGKLSPVHGEGGPVCVQPNPDPDSRSDAFLNGAVELGYDGPDWDYNGERQENGAGVLQFSITRDNKRASSAQAYLDPASGRTNLTVITGAHVFRLDTEGSRVTGVSYSKDGQTHQVHVEREVVVCGGAFLSPKLLMLSGIGPAKHLSEVGIEVKADLPGVGQNLQDHLQLPVVYAGAAERPLPTLLTGNTMFVNTRTDRPDAPPDLQLNFTPAVPKPLAPVLNIPVPVGIFLPILIQPDSTGTLTLRSSDPNDAPRVHPNYLSEAADVQTFVKAIDLIRDIAGTKAMSEAYVAEVVPGREADLEGFIRSQVTTIWHPAGTCRIGQDEQAVVDPQLRVRGFDNLRVADASVMPTVTSGNTQAACFVIGERAADLILNHS
ncbi:putative GMC-type oxidoreductase [Abditibacteriota bacterium]|nr:putative GMC-type oxidoreductase [Abditibacteriota bacterium]